jgi:hypothetical protein
MACSVHIKWTSHERIGTVTLRSSNALGDSIWQPAREEAARFFGVEREDISVLNVIHERETLSVEAASNLPISRVRPTAFLQVRSVCHLPYLLFLHLCKCVCS